MQDSYPTTYFIWYPHWMHPVLYPRSTKFRERCRGCNFSKWMRTKLPLFSVRIQPLKWGFIIEHGRFLEPPTVFYPTYEVESSWNLTVSGILWRILGVFHHIVLCLVYSMLKSRTHIILCRLNFRKPRCPWKLYFGSNIFKQNQCQVQL
jgi:hypothetical protein